MTMTTSVRLARLEAVRNSLDRLTNFLTPALPFLNSHNVDFFVKAHWDRFLPLKLREDLEELPVTPKLLKSYIDDLCTGKWKNASISQDTVTPFHACSLEELVQSIGELSLENMNISIPMDRVPFLKAEAEDKAEIKLDIGVAECDLRFDKFMTAKKMHEVETMSYLIYRVAKAASTKRLSASRSGDENDDGEDYKFEQNHIGKRSKIKNLVDVGSGKGYLSSFLVLLYKFQVFGLDSSLGNTKASTERSQKLRKVWVQLLRRAIERGETGGCSSRRGKSSKYHSKNVREEDNVPVSDCSREFSSEVNEYEIQEKLTNLQLVVHKGLNLNEVLREFELLHESPAEEGMGVVGLHTCGNLGTDSIYLFLQHKNAVFLCNVPCCYHHLEEEAFPSTLVEIKFKDLRANFEKKTQSDFWVKEDSALNPSPTFPLSEHLRKKEFNLGRNARMLSSFTFQRMSMELEELSVDRSLIWRLLLQVIIQEKQGHTLLDYQVGRIGRRCNSFEEYVPKALAKLHLNELSVTTEEIRGIYAKYEPHIQKFHCYYIIRTMLAPLVENCILLDRLIFLLEQPIVKDAFIVKLFDQFKSPRAHAIVAFKS